MFGRGLKREEILSQMTESFGFCDLSVQICLRNVVHHVMTYSCNDMC